MLSRKIQVLGLVGLSLLGGCTFVTTDALEVSTAALSSQINASSPPSPTTPAVSPNITSNQSTNLTATQTSTEPQLKVAALPSSLALNQNPLTLSAEVLFADGTRNDRVGYKLSDESLASLEDGKLTPLKAGTLTIEIYSLEDPELHQQVFIKITDPAANPTPEPTPSVAVIPDYNELGDYFDLYQVGMKWTYNLAFGGALIEVLASTEEDISLPAIIQLSGGLTLENATIANAEEKLQTLIDENSAMATWRLEVVAVEENNVTIRSTLTSNTPGIASQEATEANYTPATLNLLFGNSPAQEADPNNLTISLTAKNQSLDMGAIFGPVTVNKYIGQQRLSGTQGHVERNEYAMEPERGLMQQVVTTFSEQFTVKVESILVLSLLNFSDGSSAAEPSSEPTAVPSTAP